MDFNLSEIVSIVRRFRLGVIITCVEVSADRETGGGEGDENDENRETEKKGSLRYKSITGERKGGPLTGEDLMMCSRGESAQRRRKHDDGDE
jgi:hypothetical protein